MDKYLKVIDKIQTFFKKYLHGKDKAINLAMLTFFSRGHLLIEDSPGLGKTTLAIAIAKSMGVNFGRIQCTNDLLPTDITGLNIFNKEKGEFEFKQGPIFNNILLVDEINRATPKTQSALLEAMGEKQVTVEGKTYKLNKPFFVIATQNSSESYGTFPLPESQLDRFVMKISLGYPSKEDELEILKGGSSRGKINDSNPVVDKSEVLETIDYINRNVKVSDKILNYLLEIVGKTRENDMILSGLSTRAALSIVNVAKSSAFFSSRDYVIPEDILNYYPYTMPHRLLFKERLSNTDKIVALKELIRSVKLPY
ncbi:MAG: MoxR-like ATPase [Deferribacteres bacterium]|jgi:MoxR-like ATPase|nr:ATPase, family [Deferribacteraceae bacterium]MDK2791327.1 MoxR-like ATPase [Deferribacteres bacterium]